MATMILGLAACGGDDQTAKGTTGSAGAASSSADRAAAQDAWDLKMVRCLRKGGIQIEDPKPGEGFPGFERPANFPQISAGCQKQIGPPPSAVKSPAERKANFEASLRFARCLRDKGYDVDDPTEKMAIQMPSGVKDADIVACTPKSNDG
ncbi:hypothetical protein [Patulibacter defluvii]|uniref:hypothetical protein n=1 Tax=Patulibacter defluvii TaxID=3095358 RepID=UPI002A74A3A0|nr:hypothetical protein [Patulibacter sp. DM4]